MDTNIPEILPINIKLFFRHLKNLLKQNFIFMEVSYAMIIIILKVILILVYFLIIHIT